MSLLIDLDDVHEHDPDLSEAIVENCRRYVNLFADVVSEMLPTYKEKEVLKRWTIVCLVHAVKYPIFPLFIFYEALFRGLKKYVNPLQSAIISFWSARYLFWLIRKQIFENVNFATFLLGSVYF